MKINPDDRVLIAYIPTPTDFDILVQEQWYRIPYKHIPKGVYSEFYAFYFGKKFGSQKWAINYVAENRGHELVRRRDLFPSQLDHPRADEVYLKVQFGPLFQLDSPIISLKRRRILFIHTTGDRLMQAKEINDLVLRGGELVDRDFTALKDGTVDFYTAHLNGDDGVIAPKPPF